MSWGFSYAGEPKKVAEKMDTEVSEWCPKAIKEAVKSIAARVPDDRILIVESNGHVETRKEANDPGTTVVGGHPDGQFDVYGSGRLDFKILKMA